VIFETDQTNSSKSSLNKQNLVKGLDHNEPFGLTADACFFLSLQDAGINDNLGPDDTRHHSRSQISSSRILHLFFLYSRFMYTVCVLNHEDMPR
jgi:hypothetical protein